jgi:MoaA/NifB/PqqE/SkfB family radical SAM enzyme
MSEDKADTRLMTSHDCLECVHCTKGKVLRDGNILVKCKLQEKAYVIDNTLHSCPHHRFKLFEDRKQSSFLPYHIWIEITNACNLKCRMCGQRGTKGYLNSPESEMRRRNLPVEVWKAFIDDVATFRPTILLRGGEPLLYPKIADLMRHIHANNLFLSMDTNGTHLKQHAYDVARYVDHINISIDGPRAVHDFIRGVPGTYDAAREGLAALQAAYRELGIRRIRPVSLNCVVSDDNYESLPEMIAVAEELGVKDVMLTLCFFYDEQVEKDYDKAIRRHLAVTSRAGKGFRKESKEINGETLTKNIRLLLDHKDIEFNLMPHLNNESLKKWFDDSRLLVSYDRCYAPWFLVNVMPDGDVNFCADIGDYVLGNITEQSLLEIWSNEKAVKFRERILEERFSICRRCVVNFLYPYNRCSALVGLRTASKVIKYGLKTPFFTRYWRKHEWLMHSFY